MRRFRFELLLLLALTSCETLHPIEYHSPVPSTAEAIPFKNRGCGLYATYLEDAAIYKDDFHAALKSRGFQEMPLDQEPSFQLEVTARNLPDEKKNWARINLRRIGVVVFKQVWKVSESAKEPDDESLVDRKTLVTRVINKLPDCTEAWKLGEGSFE